MAVPMSWNDFAENAELKVNTCVPIGGLLARGCWVLLSRGEGRSPDLSTPGTIFAAALPSPVSMRSGFACQD